MSISRRAVFLWLALWAAALAVAPLFDRQVAQWVHDARPLDKHDWWVRVIRLPGNFVFVACVAAALALFHRRWQAAVPLLLSGPIVGLVYLSIKWLVGRRRPVIVIAPFAFHPLIHGVRGLFGAESGLSFPSGDATMAFAAAGCLAAVLPRWTAAFFAAAALVAAERVLENAHYVSDVIAGGGLGVLCALVALRLAGRLSGRKPMIEGFAGDASPMASSDEVDATNIRTCGQDS